MLGQTRLAGPVAALQLVCEAAGLTDDEYLLLLLYVEYEDASWETIARLPVYQDSGSVPLSADSMRKRIRRLQEKCAIARLKISDQLEDLL